MKRVYAGFLGSEHHRLEGVEIDRGRELFVEFEAGVIGDAGQIDEGVVPSIASASFAVSRISP